MDWYILVLKRFTEFEGRSRRREFWMFALVHTLISVALTALDYTLGLVMFGSGILTSLYGLVVFLPALAVSVRRLHDTNRSGFWVFICFIPIIGVLVYLFFLVQDSSPGSNQYGARLK